MNFFNTDEEMQVFIGRLSALMRNTDFLSVVELLKKYDAELVSHLRYVEDDAKFRHLQGRTQVLGELLELCEKAKSGQF